MPIPDYQTLMLPLLRFLEDNKEHPLQEAVEHLSNEYRLSPEERQQLLPSGQQTIIRNRVGWARTYMKKAGLIDPVKRGYFRLSDKGKEVLKKKPEKVNVHFLEQFPVFVAFRELHNKPHEKPEIVPDVEQTPEEALDGAYQRLREDLEAEILQQVNAVSPAFFERLVVELLVKMGYGGNLHDAGQAVGQSGDGGIDGIIKEDRLGLDVIYIQAKRWQGTVGRPEIQKFAGVLQGHRAKKGVFITSSDFSREALEFAEKIDSRIVRLFRNSCGRESRVFQALGHEVESTEMKQDGHPKAFPVTKSTRHLLHPLNPRVLCLEHRIRNTGHDRVEDASQVPA